MSGSVRGKIVQNGLIFYIDPSNLNSYTAGSENIFDISKNYKDCSLVNGVTYSSLAQGSLSFDGVDDYAVVPALGLLNDFTVSCWFRIIGASTASSVNQYASLLTIGSTQKILLRTSNTPSLRYALVSMGTDSNNYISTNLFTYGSWNNLTFTYNSTTDTGRIYLNNIKTQFTNSTIRYTNSSRYIGTQTVPPDTVEYEYILRGNISNFLIYNRELSEVEVTNNYNALRGKFGR
jgi:hypothetical protein